MSDVSPKDIQHYQYNKIK